MLYPDATPEVAPARKADIRELGRTLGRAFFDDPVMTWMFPQAGRRAKALPKMFATMTRHQFLGHGGVEVASDGVHIAAAALWSPPGRWQTTPWQDLRMIAGFLGAMGLHVKRGQQVGELMKKHHPEQPHWYLGVIGSDPTFRGGGYGHALMASRLDRCDAEFAPSYLESSNPVNVPYYQRFGFEVTGEIQLPDGGPVMWQMWREPR
ncbi:GNAT family N-acetyltransferase [[Mycobacterium] wendilense]|uniref:GNAT family N-acetyltransferase n=1 Tax=[Mycobacterium] wendilense TaxID=3064284 RepID=A0ABN9P0S2_9MYCO|nr:GNAT family N-acetyltransferase [Mycolicibacterium sp. MU0050]CAJ1581660.1 GNAT family N-acetyltransferase [Mycolicibacterium sp. MU0050]